MKLLLFIIVVVTLFGPLRPWFRRHWAFLVSIFVGGLFGLFLAGYTMAAVGCKEPMMPLILMVSCAIWAGRYGPPILRRIERDGRDGNAS